MARLPTPGGDDGSWGSILNDFLSQAHTSGGSLKTSALSAAGAELKADKGLAGGYAPLDGSGRVPFANLPPTSVPDADSTTKGIVQLAGDLSGTATAPTVPGLVNKANTADVLLKANDLNDLNDASTARTNLGLGSAALSDAGDFEASGSLSAHAADTTSVHGIADTSILETTTGSQAKVDTHVNDTSDAHDASAISFSPAGTIAATDVQAAIEEVAAEATGATNLSWDASTSTVQSDTGTDAAISNVDGSNSGLMTVADKAKLDGIEPGAAADQAANEVSITDSGAYFTSANVEGALQELGAGVGGGGSITYLSFDATTPSIANGTTYTNSFSWSGAAGTQAIRHLRLEPSNPGMIFDLKILRQNDFTASGLTENIAFWVKSVQGNFQREFIWEYEDEDASEMLHVWINNTSVASGTVRILLNNRIAQ